MPQISNRHVEKAAYLFEVDQVYQEAGFTYIRGVLEVAPLNHEVVKNTDAVMTFKHSLLTAEEVAVARMLKQGDCIDGYMHYSPEGLSAYTALSLTDFGLKPLP